ncbi:hypothetical protein [Curtobacterium flaccumfaciens]|uniref:hypothetical protein n=1 Tax=Curtobacterium flaccumfaciens TaxID=2035 RepID=UPI001E45CDFE|nr:hypothetical protein [Curtobacterium allii]MCE0459511.1 hypothetical protein [Curtobacterium allii]
MILTTPDWLRRYVNSNEALTTTYRVAGRVIVAAVPAFALTAGVAHFVDGLTWLPILVAVVGGLAIVAWLTLNTMRWWNLGPARWGILAPKARQAHMREVWRDAAADALDRDIWVFRVVDVTYTGPQGSRGVVEHRDGSMQDTWFWHEQPRKGRVYVARGNGASMGRLDRHRVMFVGDETTGPGILYSIPAAAWRQRRVHRVRFE